jgi:3-oxoacyl-[acyl-carrier protein] reductase
MSLSAGTSRSFQGRVVLVTGASGGIGSAIALAFAQRGASVVVHHHKGQQRAQEVVQKCSDAGGDGWAVVADLTDAHQVQALADQIKTEMGALDVLVHNAFAPYRFDPDRRQRFWELNWGHVQAQIDGSVKASFELAQACLPMMRGRSGANMVFMASDLVTRPTIAYADYATAKSALVGMARQMTADLGPLGLRVNTVAPGLVQGTRASEHTPESVREQILRQTPLGRIATPADVAGAVCLLASDEAAFITGQLLHVDGGLVMT